MGIFDKFKKNTTVDVEQEKVTSQPNVDEVDTQPEEAEPKSVPSVKVDLTSGESVDKRLRELYNMESLYIILSAEVADFERGLSIPMVLMPSKDDKQRVMLIFSDYEKAKIYVSEKRPMVVDGVYPIGEAKKSDNINNIDVICANAMAFGVTAIDFDVDDENGFGCQLQYFMQVNKMSGEGQIIFSNEEMEQIKANDGKFTPRFNAMHIVDFTNPYRITKERAEEVLNKGFAEDGIEWARENMAIHEMCYVANEYMHEAARQEEQGREDISLIQRERTKQLNEVIFDKLAKLDSWYTIFDEQTDEIFTKNGAVYVIYTERYANRMPNGTVLKPIPPNVAELAYLIGEKPVNIVVVTDGPHIMHLIDRTVFGF